MGMWRIDDGMMRDRFRPDMLVSYVSMSLWFRLGLSNTTHEEPGQGVRADRAMSKCASY